MIDTEKKETTITGELARIIFSNDSGFLIGSFNQAQEHKTFTAVGNLINPQIMMNYKFFGDWTTNPKFGEQFTFTRFETEIPSDPDGIFKYLVRICKYVGSSVGQKLIDNYGVNTITVMKTDPERVASEIKGITSDRAKEIQKTLVENKTNEKVMIELESILDVQGMFKNLPGKLYTEYRANAAEKIKKNPYILTRFPMVGFALADRVALHIGFSGTSIERKQAAAKHCLAENAQNGNTWILVTDLVQKMLELIQIVGLEDGIKALIHDGVVVLDDAHVAFRGSASDERIIAGLSTKMLSLPCASTSYQEIQEVAA